MNRNLPKFFLMFLSILFLFSFSYASQIEGYVLDGQTGDGLPGANVFLEGTSLGSATDVGGKFVIPNVPAGSYTLVVNYVGYQEKTVDITVEEGQKLQQVIDLDFQAIEGEVIEVTAQAVGQMQAINQQLASDKIASIVSEQRIQELPDFNAASALSRLPGVSTTQSSGEDNKVIIRGLSPKYNSIEVEGIKLASTGSSSIGLVSDVFTTTAGVNTDRSVDLTMVSPYMIRTIAVYKSLTPDMNANSIGGTVNMELRESPSGLKWSALYQQGYTAKSNTIGNYRAVVSGSNRFLNDKLGVYALLNAESYDRNSDNMSASYIVKGDASTIDPVTGYRPVAVGTVTFNRHLETRDRYGANLILDYNLPEGSIKFVNMYAKINSDYTEHQQFLNYDNGVIQWRLRQGENEIDQQMHSLKLDYNFGPITTDVSISYTSSKNVLDNARVMNFNQSSAILFSGPERYNVAPENLKYLLGNVRGDSLVVLRSGNLYSSDYKEEKFTYKADFELPFNIGNMASGSFKFGGQIYNQSNSIDQETPYVAFDGSTSGDESIANEMQKALYNTYGLSVSEQGKFTGTSFLNNDNTLWDPFLDDKFGDIFFVSNPSLLTSIMNYVSSNPDFDATNALFGSDGNDGGWYNGLYQRLTNDYSYDEDYYATYAMTTFNFMDFSFIGGARYEKVETKYFAWNGEDMRNVITQQMYDTTSLKSNEFVLPMGQVKYTPFEWMDVRYAYTQTLSRPDYHALTPKFTYTQGNTIHTGNPDLKPAKAQNHDLNFSFHTSKLGLFTVGGFYKTIEDFAYNANYRIDAAENAGFDYLANYTLVKNGQNLILPESDATVYRPLNNPFDATVKGLEIDFQHNFWYLPKPFNNIVLGINYARIWSESKYPIYGIQVIPQPRPNPPLIAFVDSSFTGRLIDQPDHVLNSYIGYDYKGFSARISAVYQDNSARGNGGWFPENNNYGTEYFRLDFSARQQLPVFNSELFMDIRNLNNANPSWIQRSINGFMGIENYGLTLNLGLRIKY
ncbi:MAG: TonB-dependent receptor [Calditrichaceae bacterium]|nr:TonB-dependent receptor [Calditrichaceae bacterium]RQV94607.1 MAG: TonB-dependent receptor [Calditrichota bacterium]